MKSERRQPGTWLKRRPAPSYSAGALHGCPGQWLSTPSCRWVHARWGQGRAADWPSRSKASWPACSTTRCSPWALPPPPLARHNSPWHHVCLHAHATVQWSATSTAFLGSAVAPCGHIQASQLGTAPRESGLGPGPFFPLLTVARGASLQVFACCCLLLASQQPSAWEAADRQLLATSLAACAVAAAACIAWHALTCAEHGPSYAYLRCMEVVSLALRMGVALAWPPLLRCGILLPAFRQPAACPPTACL